ncbi:50S ribosomal protein L32e [Candidatus Woesearchaeota archaeon]|nr:50S ribosomal protein L32e [Candidatus Woesearchaeota archaeon]
MKANKSSTGNNAAKADVKRLLEVRAKRNLRKPAFIRQDAHKIKRLEKKWRKPKGVHSKMKNKKKGHRRSAATGWGAPAQVRGLHNSGLALVLVNNVAEVSRADPKTEAVIVSGKMGAKQRINVVDAALKRELMIVNIKKPEAWLEKARKSLAEKRIEKAKLKEKRDKKQKEKEKQAEKAEKEEKGKKEESIDAKVESDEEKQKREKLEKDKLLTKRT